MVEKDLQLRRSLVGGEHPVGSIPTNRIGQGFIIGESRQWQGFHNLMETLDAVVLKAPKQNGTTTLENSQ